MITYKPPGVPGFALVEGGYDPPSFYPLSIEWRSMPEMFEATKEIERKLGYLLNPLPASDWGNSDTVSERVRAVLTGMVTDGTLRIREGLWTLKGAKPWI